MGKVIHRINAPFVTGPVMMRAFNDAVERRVPHHNVPRRHVDFRAQDAIPFFELAVFHPFKEVKILIDRTVAVGAFFAGFSQGPPVLTDLIGRQTINVRLALLNKLNGILIKFFKIIRSVKQLALPIKPQPFDILLDRLNVSVLFFRRIGVIEAQVTGRIIF
jgi:hypothetical protein